MVTQAHAHGVFASEAAQAGSAVDELYATFMMRTQGTSRHPLRPSGYRQGVRHFPKQPVCCGGVERTNAAQATAENMQTQVASRYIVGCLLTATSDALQRCYW
jgi:hypothetical protein